MNFFQRIPLYCFSIFYPCKVYNRKNIPEGGAILVSNHLRGIDPGFVSRAYNKDLHYLAKSELYENKFLAKILKDYGAIPIDRDKPNVKQLLMAIKVLKEDHKLLIFPEGTRNRTKTTEIQPIKGGTGIFAIKSKKPIVPVIIHDYAKMFRRTKVIVGEPFTLEKYYDRKLSDEDMVEIDNLIVDKMKEQQKILSDLLKNKKNNKNKKKNNNKTDK